MKKLIAISALVLFAASLSAGMVAEKKAPIAIDSEKCPKTMFQGVAEFTGTRTPTPDSLYYHDFTGAWGYSPCVGCRAATHYTTPAPFDMYMILFWDYNSNWPGTDSLPVDLQVTGCNPDGSPDETNIIGGPYSLYVDGGSFWRVQFDIDTISFGVGEDFCITQGDQVGWGQNCWIFDDGTDVMRSYMDFGDGVWVQETGGDLLQCACGEVGDYFDAEDICVDILNQDGVPDFFYPYCDTLYFSSHIMNRGNISGVVTDVDFEVYAQALDTAGEWIDSLLVYSENVAYGSAIAPGMVETVTVWTVEGVHLDVGVYRIVQTVNATGDEVLDNNVKTAEVRIYDANAGYWMYLTDYLADAAFGWGDGTGNAWAVYYHPKVFPVNLDTIGFFLGQDGDTGLADVGVYEYDPVTGLPSTEIVRWEFDSIAGGFFWNFYASDTLGNPVPIVTIDSVGFVVAYYFQAGVSPGAMDTLRLYADQSPPRAGANHCVEITSYVWLGDGWYTDTGGDWFIWASISPGVMPYMCGDTNGDETLTTGDGFNLLNYFGSTGAIVDMRTADVNGDCTWTTGDGFQLLNYFGSTGSLDCDDCWPGCTNCD
jgi:hypothetical protein